MEALLKRYIRLIIEIQLKLQPGDGLSINTESNVFSFARLFADEATKATGQVVTIVETNNGKVVQAISIEPAEKEIFRPPLKGVVMCHIVDLGAFPYLSDIDLQQAVDDVAKLALYGLLSDPVFLDRRIAVPWANIPYPSERWSMQLLGTGSSMDDMWSLFSTLYRLQDDYALPFWDEQANLLDYRKRKLNSLGRGHLSIIGDSFRIQAYQARDTKWAGGRITLSNTRNFIPTIPIQAIHAAVDRSSTEGTIKASKPFYLLGRNVIGAHFTIEKGEVVSYQAEQGKEALDAFFSIDEGAKRVSEICLADDDTIESRYISSSIHPHWAKDITSSIVFGGFSLDNLTTQQNEEDVETTNLNQSLVRLEVPIGDRHLSLSLQDEAGNDHLLIEEGVFID